MPNITWHEAKKEGRGKKGWKEGIKGTGARKGTQNKRGKRKRKEERHKRILVIIGISRFTIYLWL